MLKKLLFNTLQEPQQILEKHFEKLNVILSGVEFIREIKLSRETLAWLDAREEFCPIDQNES